MSESPEEQDRVIIRDNRKIDPVTGEARKPEATGPAGDESGALATEPAEGPMVEASLLDERTRDLQRVQAEYANYRKRMDREVEAAVQRGVGRALSALLPVLDDWQRAKEHGDVSGPIASILEKEERALATLGLEPVGEEGDPFDPTVHEAVMHDESAEVSVPTCTKILRKGYRHGERLLRPAMVGVTDPSGPTGGPVSAPEATPEPAAETAAPEDDAQQNNEQ